MQPSPPAKALARLERGLTTARESRQPVCVGVCGVYGSGRSALLDHFRAQHSGELSDLSVLRAFGLPGGGWRSPSAPFDRLLHVALGLDQQEQPARRSQRAVEALVHRGVDREAAQLSAEWLLRGVEADGDASSPAASAEARLRAIGTLAGVLRAFCDRGALLLLVEDLGQARSAGWSILAELKVALQDAPVLIIAELDACDGLAAEAVWPGLFDEVVRLPAPVSAPAANLAGMDAKALSLLRWAALSGPVFWSEALPALVRLELTPLSIPGGWEARPTVPEIDAVLGASARAGWLRRVPAVGALTGWTLVDPGVRSQLLKALEPRQRVAGHGLLAEWFTRAEPIADGPTLHRAIAQHLADAGQSRQAAAAAAQAGALAKRVYDHRAALAHFTIAAAWLDPRDGLLGARIFHAIGALSDLLGRVDAARGAFERMLALAWSRDDLNKGGAALNRLGRLARAQRQLAEAEGLLTAGRALFEQAGDCSGVSASIDDLGQTAALGGDHERAERLYFEALERRKEAGDERAVALSLTNLARIWRGRGLVEKAEAALREALELRARTADAHGLVDSRLALVELLLHNGRLADADAEAARASESARRIGSRVREARAMALEGLVAAARGHMTVAVAQGRAARRLAEQVSDAKARAQSARAEAMGISGRDPEGALAVLLAGLDFATHHDQPVEAAYDRLLEARLCARLAGLGEPDGSTTPPRTTAPSDGSAALLDRAIAAAERAVLTFDRVADVPHSVQSRQLLSTLLSARGHTSRSLEVRAQAAQLALGRTPR